MASEGFTSPDRGEFLRGTAHLVGRQDRVWRAGEGINLEIEQARQTAEILDVLGGEDQRHARQIARPGCIDGVFRMRVG